MLRFSKQNTTILFPVALLALSLAGCGGDDSDDNAQDSTDQNDTTSRVYGNTPEEQAVVKSADVKPVSVRVVDANTGDLLENSVEFSLSEAVSDVADAVFPLRVKGVDSSKLVKEAGDTHSRTVVADTGSIALAVKAAADLKSQPAVRVLADAEGYFDGSTTIRLNDSVVQGNEPLVYEIRLVSKEADQQPAGVSFGSRNIPAGDGGQYTVGAGDGEFTFDNGTLKTADGQALSGDLTVDTAYFDPNQAESQASFPGGFGVEADADASDSDANSTDGEGAFITGGFMAVEITDENGNRAHDLGSAATIRMNVSNVNGDDGEPLVVGDEVPIWSRNDETGQWTQTDQTTQVQSDTQGQYIEFSTNHLSYFNLDWKGSRCPDRTVTLVSGSGQDFEMPPTGINLVSTIDGREMVYGQNILGDKENTLMNSPADRAVTYTASYGDSSVEKEIPAGDCEDFQIDIDSFLPLPESRTVEFSVRIAAPNNQTFRDVDDIIGQANDYEFDAEGRQQRIDILNFTHEGSEPAEFPEDESSAGLSQAAYEARQDRYQFLVEKDGVRQLDPELRDVLLTGYDSSGNQVIQGSPLDADEVELIEDILLTEFVLQSGWLTYSFEGDKGTYYNGSVSLNSDGGTLKLPPDEAGTLDLSFNGVVQVSPNIEESVWVPATVEVEADTENLGDIRLTDGAAVADIYRALIRTL